jgi:predicted nucleotidyltransferase component of viral defense system
VEQDLVLSRALVEIFDEPVLAERLLLRGGTAFHKLLLSTPARYSEDIDLVQSDAGPSGDLIDAIRGRLDGWLGRPRRDRAHGSVRIAYRFESEAQPVQSLRLKIEVNTREHFAVLELEKHQFSVESSWFRGAAQVRAYAVDSSLPPRSERSTSARRGGTCSTSGLPLIVGS